MLVVGILYTIALWLAFFAFFEDKQDAYTRGIFVTVVFVLCSFVAFRPIGSTSILTPIPCFIITFVRNSLRCLLLGLCFSYSTPSTMCVGCSSSMRFCLCPCMRLPSENCPPEVLLSVLLWLSHYFLIQDFHADSCGSGFWFHVGGLALCYRGQALEIPAVSVDGLVLPLFIGSLCAVALLWQQETQTQGKAFHGWIDCLCLCLVFCQGKLADNHSYSLLSE